MADPLSLLAIGGLIYVARKCSDTDEKNVEYYSTEDAMEGSLPNQAIDNNHDQSTILMNTLSRSWNPDPGLSGRGVVPPNGLKDDHPSFGDVAFMKHVNGEPVIDLHNRPYVSGQMNNFGPAEKQLVGPGLGVGPDVPAYGGYQQVFRVMPNNVGGYKMTTLPGRAGPAHSVIGGMPALAGEVNHKAPPKTAFLPTRRPTVEGRAQGQGGALTGVTVRSEYEKTKRPTIRSETTWRNDGLEFNPAKRVVSARTLAQDPTRNKGDLNDGQFNYNNQPVPGITNFFGGYLETPASQLMDTGRGAKGYTTEQLEQYGFRPDDRRGKKDRDGNPGRMNVRANPLNQEGLLTAVRSDCNKYDGRTGPVNGGYTQNYVQDKYQQLNSFKGQKNPYSSTKELNLAKEQLQKNPLSHTLST